MQANPSYVDMVDQTTLGHRLIKQQFGVTPKVTWQIDPFGEYTSLRLLCLLYNRLIHLLSLQFYLGFYVYLLKRGRKTNSSYNEYSACVFDLCLRI